MLYRPNLEPLSKADFDAQYHLIAQLSLEFTRACSHLETMRQNYSAEAYRA